MQRGISTLRRATWQAAGMATRMGRQWGMRAAGIEMRQSMGSMRLDERTAADAVVEGASDGDGGDDDENDDEETAPAVMLESTKTHDECCSEIATTTRTMKRQVQGCQTTK
jgi:hypothetical protein